MTKEDYMRLSKERLAELLEMYDNAQAVTQKMMGQITPISVVAYEPPCFHGGLCTNPFHDCINCPRVFGWARGITANTNTTSTDEIK